MRGLLVRIRLGRKQSTGLRLLWRKPLFGTAREQAAAIIQKWYRCEECGRGAGLRQSREKGAHLNS